MNGNYPINLPYVTVTIGMRVVPTDLLTSVIKDVQTELKLLKEAGQNLAAPVTVN